MSHGSLDYPRGGRPDGLLGERTLRFRQGSKGSCGNRFNGSCRRKRPTVLLLRLWPDVLPEFLAVSPRESPVRCTLMVSMPFFSREFVRLSLEALRQGYSPLLTVSLPCMLSKKIPTCSSAQQADRAALRFGSGDEREWLNDFFRSEER